MNIYSISKMCILRPYSWKVCTPSVTSHASLGTTSYLIFMFRFALNWQIYREILSTFLLNSLPLKTILYGNHLKVDVNMYYKQHSDTYLGKVILFMLAVDDLRGKGAVGTSHHEQVFVKWCLWSKLEWFASALNQWFRTVCEVEMASPCSKYCYFRELNGLY